MQKKLRTDFATIKLVDNMLLSISTSNRIILDLEMAKQLVSKCMELRAENFEDMIMVFDMSKTAFVTEDARTYITGIGSVECGLRALALVSDNHLGNVVSTLMIAYGESDNLPMKLFRSHPEAENWLMREMKSIAA